MKLPEAQLMRTIEFLGVEDEKMFQPPKIWDMRRMHDERPHKYRLLPGEQVGQPESYRISQTRRDCYIYWEEKIWSTSAPAHAKKRSEEDRL